MRYIPYNEIYVAYLPKENCMCVHSELFYKNILSRLIFSKGFPSISDAKESSHSAGDLGSISELGRSPGHSNGNPL